MTRLAPANLMLCHDGSLEGFFSCVFDAYALRSYPRDIVEERLAEPRLGEEVRVVPTDVSHALRVRDGLVRRAGIRAYRRVRTAFLSDREGREAVLFDYIVRGVELGGDALEDLTCPCVEGVRELDVSVMNEREKMLQFLRFEELEGGVYLARIHPKANVIPIMMRHFVERFSTQPFVIYDEGHGLAGVWDGKRQSFVVTDGLSVPDPAKEEREYQRLWKVFYDSVSNEQRFNPDLRRSLMPKRFWRDLPEMRAAVESRAHR